MQQSLPVENVDRENSQPCDDPNDDKNWEYDIPKFVVFWILAHFSSLFKLNDFLYKYSHMWELN